MTTTNRRALLVAGGLALAQHPFFPVRAARETVAARGIGASPPSAQQGNDSAAGSATGRKLDHFPVTDPADATAVVGAAHTDIATVIELVGARPHLARATVDWGFGDWESALGAASHMGRRDIADFLLAHGARPDIFSAAMMGQLAAVRALVEASPGVQRIPGPHGITLLAHARAGGEAAAPVYDYLEGLGDADLRPDTVALADAQRAALAGRYRFDAALDAVLEITDERGALWLRRQGREFGRRLFPVSGNEFYPSGSPSVRIVFDLADGRPAMLRVIDSAPVLTATRNSG